jgi:hypothetical protein
MGKALSIGAVEAIRREAPPLLETCAARAFRDSFFLKRDQNRPFLYCALRIARCALTCVPWLTGYS